MTTRPLTGSLTVPGDKSIAQRSLLLAALAGGRSQVAGMPDGADTASTAGCIARLGAAVSSGQDGAMEIDGGRLAEAGDVLDVGNSGTAIRCLLGVCSGLPGALTVLTGDRSIRSRPMLRVVAPLREMGAQIWGAHHGDRAPLAVQGGALVGIERDLEIASAQVKTALLLAGLSAEGPTSVSTPGPVRDHTERMLTALGCPLEIDGHRTTVKERWRPSPFGVTIPGDISSAMYLIAAALMIPGSELSIEGVGLNPTRAGALEVLRSMGADIDWTVEGRELGEPTGSVTVRYTDDLRGVEVQGPDLIPRLIDEIPILSVVATQAHGITVFRDSSELRHKESDRIETMVAGLTALGVEAAATPDGMTVSGPSPLSGGVVSSHGDHRVALSFAVAGLISKDKVRVEGWNAVQTSFPGFLGLVASAQRKKGRSR